MKPWENYGTGSVVRWFGELWVVGSATPKGLTLISVNHPRATAHPSENWPKDEVRQRENPETGAEEEVLVVCTTKIETVEFVASTVSEYIRTSLMRTLFPDLPVNRIG